MSLLPGNLVSLFCTNYSASALNVYRVLVKTGTRDRNTVSVPVLINNFRHNFVLFYRLAFAVLI